MKKSTIYLAQRLTSMPNEEPGTHPIIKIITHLPAGQDNSFYIDIKDLKSVPINLAFDHPPTQGSINPDEMNENDVIEFNLSDGIFHKAVLWNKRKIRQVGYAFDYYDKTRNI